MLPLVNRCRRCVVVASRRPPNVQQGARYRDRFETASATKTDWPVGGWGWSQPPPSVDWTADGTANFSVHIMFRYMRTARICTYVRTCGQRAWLLWQQRS